MAAGELGLLLNDHMGYGNWKDTVPNRSGSAPPSMEGSLAALGHFIGQRNPRFEGSVTNFSNSVESWESEEQLRADPAYLAYYCSNVNLNPRLPRPLMSQENRRLVHHFGDNWRVASLDDTSNGSFFLSRPVLSTHKEEPEDDKSPGLVSSDSQCTTDAEGHHQSPVDLIQEDFPRTPSPVYNNQSYPSVCKSTEETAVDACVNPLHDSSTSIAESSELCMATTGVWSHTPTPRLSSIRPVPSTDFSATPSPSSSYSEITVGLHHDLKGDLSSGNNNMDNEAIVKGAAVLSIGSINSEMKTLRITNDGHRNQPAKQHRHRSSLHQEGSSKLIHGDQSQMISLTPPVQNAWENFPHGHPKLSSVEVQPVLPSDGATQPFYTTATAYGNSYYPGLQPTSFFTPQYNVGYALSTSFMPPIISGYSPHTAIPVPIDDRTSLALNARPSGPGVGGNITPGAEFEHQYKFYGHLGVTMQPSIPDPMYVQYFQHSSLNAYNGGGVVGNLADSYDPQKVLSSAAYSPDQRPQFLGNGGASKSSNTQGGAVSANYQWNSPYMGVLTSYPTSALPSPVTSPLSSPLFHGSPVPVASLSRGRNENVRLSHSSGRNVAASSGRLGQRERVKVDDPKSYSFLDELKSNRTRRYELFDIAGRIVEFSADQHGSRFIQQKLETCSTEEKASVFKEVLPYASTLTTDVFGNYVIQKFFEHGSPDQRRELANQLTGHVLPLSLQMYGCRVIQKALEVIELDQKTQLVLELDGHVMRCVCDQNGNHVIQKCIECVPTEKINFVISAFRGQVALLSTHPYGCRVIQRVLEHCTDKLQSQCIVDEILQSACSLAEDQYGNYVTQHVLERGTLHERSQIISKLAGQVVRMSQNKFASNVIEKCLEHGDAAERDLLIEEIVGQTEGNDNLLTMMKDQFANYVVQKILEICTDKQREILVSRIRVHLPSLKKYTYGKHIVARVEQLFGEGIHALES